MTYRNRLWRGKRPAGDEEDPGLLGEGERCGDEADPATAGSAAPGDRKLIADFLRGEPAAVDTVSVWIGQAAGRYRGRLPAEWQDLRQDLLLEVTAALRSGTFRGGSRLRTFVWRIAHYRCLNRLRDRARQPESELEEGTLDVTDPARTVLERLVERESEDLLVRFLETVPADCRRLWKWILAGRSYREISRQTGISEAALRVRVWRCRRKALILWKTWLEQPDR